MKKQKSSWMALGFTMVIALMLGGFPAKANAKDDVTELKKQIEALQQRVNELETQKNNSPGPTLPQERFMDPFEHMERMRQEMDRIFESSFNGFGGAQSMFSSNMSFDYDLDIKDTDDGYEITFDMTGFDKDKVDIQINEDSITVKGEQSRQDSQQGPDGSFSTKSFGSFVKTIPLPSDADTAKVKTEKKENSLIITMPKKT
ncbi:MAG: Hsp20 family protein [Candidatus Omnitrophica bacterium]|nr:Hsp20 family protein [Candidatus Omnitrophota bacterium]